MLRPTLKPFCMPLASFRNRLRLTLALSAGLLLSIPAIYPALHAQQSKRSDLAIESDVLKALANYPDISSEHITATTENGIVTLNGTASSTVARDQAQVVAATVDGVRSVVNHVAIEKGSADKSSAASQPGAVTTDQANPTLKQRRQEQPAVQQAESTVPENPAQQPGTPGDWGKAGPPPDAQNGQIPPQPTPAQQAADGNDPYPIQDPGEDDNAAAPRQSAPQAQRPQYGPQRRMSEPQPNLATAPLTVPAGTLLTVRTSEPLDSRRLQGGEVFQAIVAQDIYEGEYLAIPRGAVLQGRVMGVKKPGAFAGGAGFALQITALNLSGQSYPVTTDTFASDTRGKGGYTTANTIGGAAIGAIIGGIAGRGPGAAIGAAAGGVTGAGVSAASDGPREVMPPETPLSFHLRAPLTVQPVSYAEAQRLQASVQGSGERRGGYGPRPYRRPRPYPYPYGYPAPYPYAYGYPPPPPYYYHRYPYRYYYGR